MIETEVAWAAGFFDGEGSVGRYASGHGFYKSDRPKYPKVSISNTDLSLLNRFQLAVGLGKIGGPYKYSNPTWKLRYIYRLDGQESVQKLYMLLRPYLGDVKSTAFQESLYPHGGTVDTTDSKPVDREVISVRI